MAVMTFGHGTASEEEIRALLAGAGVVALVDVRSAPGSRRNPQVAKSAIERWLPEGGIDYRWDGRLGGFRKVPAESPDVLWEKDAFRAYAGHMRSEEFLAAARELVAESEDRTVAVMCSESVWWRCHRRMIADFLELARGVEVRHLMHDGALREHPPMTGARLRDDGLLVYDGGQNSLL